MNGMDLFNVIISPMALAQLDGYIDYIQYTLLNEEAAMAVWRDAIETRDLLAKTADSLKLCDFPRLREMGYRSICFIRHRYIMLYRIEGKDVFIDAIYHQLQDYENIFSSELE